MTGSKWFDAIVIVAWIVLSVSVLYWVYSYVPTEKINRMDFLICFEA